MRNLVVACNAAFRSRVTASDAVECPFRVMPWDVGIRILKSDRYFAVAEAAQVDLVIRAGLLRRMLREGVHWANIAQSARFRIPLRLMQRYTVVTRIEAADTRHVYLSHRFVSSHGEHAEVHVKAKFKRGALTVPPQELFGNLPETKPPSALALDMG